LAERERRTRLRLREQRESVNGLVDKARSGEWRPLLHFQWPSVLLDTFQEDILDALFDPALWGIFVKGNTGCGKSAVGGMGIALYFSVWHESKIIITSATNEHAKSVLFGETATWFKRMRLPPDAFVGQEGIADGVRPKEHYAVVVNPKNDEAFSGRHGPHTLFAFDEATAIADSRYKMARTQATKFLAFSNPRTMFGFFRRAFPSDAPNENQTRMTDSGRCRFQTIDGETILNVRSKRLDKPLGPPGGIVIAEQQFAHGQPIPSECYDQVRPIIPGQICYDTFLALKSETDKRWVNVFCHARFPDEDPEKQIILGTWLMRSHALWTRYAAARARARRNGCVLALALLRKWFPVEAFGLDVAASEGGDETVLAVGGRRGIHELHACQTADTMSIVGWVIHTVSAGYGIDLTAGQHSVAVDMDGLGKGVGDRLAEQNVRVIEIHGNDPARDSKLYVNRRAERYAVLGQRLDPRGQFPDDPFMLPVDEFLAQELCAHEKVFAGSEGLRFAVTPKRKPPGAHYDGPTIHGKIGRSPDRSDAISYCYEGIQSAAGSNLEAWLNSGAF
jgi:hypothetical protein